MFKFKAKVIINTVTAKHVNLYKMFVTPSAKTTCLPVIYAQPNEPTILWKTLVRIRFTRIVEKYLNFHHDNNLRKASPFNSLF